LAPPLRDRAGFRGVAQPHPPPPRGRRGPDRDGPPALRLAPRRGRHPVRGVRRPAAAAAGGGAGAGGPGVRDADDRPLRPHRRRPAAAGRRRAAAGAGAVQERGAAGILLQAGGLIGVALLLLAGGRWRLPVGALALLVGLPATLVVLMRDNALATGRLPLIAA